MYIREYQFTIRRDAGRIPVPHGGRDPCRNEHNDKHVSRSRVPLSTGRAQNESMMRAQRNEKVSKAAGIMGGVHGSDEHEP